MPKPRKPVEPKPTAPGGMVKPMPHADSPVLAATSDEFGSRCKVDGSPCAPGERCTTCGTVMK